MSERITREVDFINHDPYDYIYQYGALSGDAYDYDGFIELIYNDFDNEFDEWLNKNYTAAEILCKYNRHEYDMQIELWDEFINEILSDGEKYGFYYILEEEDEEGE